MTITVADMAILASAAMNDTPTGGGRRGATAVLTGVQNNVFPDVTTDDRLQGITRIRKLYPSVLSDETAALASATLVLQGPPSDTTVDAVLVAFGDDNTTRQQLVDGGVPQSSLRGAVKIGNDVGFGFIGSTGTLTSGSADFVMGTVASRSAFDVLAGDLVAFTAAAGVGPALHVAQVLSVSVPTGPSGTITVELHGTYTGTTTAAHIAHLVFAAGRRAFGSVATTAEAAAAATTVSIATPLARLVPASSASYPTADLGLPPAGLSASRGRAPVLAAGDLATLWHEAETTASTQANGSTVDVGRTNLSQLAVVDNNGAELGRVLLNGPSFTGGFTVDLAAGTVTFTDVTGYAQPLKVRHRIEERVQVASLTWQQATLGAALARTFPSGSQLTAELPLGTLQATQGAAFSQQAWTRVWADAVIGSAVGTLYSGVVGLVNSGAENDRWVAVFTSTTQYTLQSERWGVVGSGNISTDYTPLHPATGQPMITLYAAGWVAGSIGIGNAYRFNTRGPYAAAWALQCVSPGAASGSSAVGLRFRGSVDA